MDENSGAGGIDVVGVVGADGQVVDAGVAAEVAPGRGDRRARSGQGPEPVFGLQAAGGHPAVPGQVEEQVPGGGDLGADVPVAARPTEIVRRTSCSSLWPRITAVTGSADVLPVTGSVAMTLSPGLIMLMRLVLPEANVTGVRPAKLFGVVSQESGPKPSRPVPSPAAGSCGA